MANADVIVMASDRPDVTLVAEVKMRVADLPAAERQLKAYMLDRRCPTALLVTPQIARIYRDTFKDFTPDSIVLAGEFGTRELLGLAAEPTSGPELESVVRAWLVRLAFSSGCPSELRPETFASTFPASAFAKAPIRCVASASPVSVTSETTGARQSRGVASRARTGRS